MKIYCITEWDSASNMIGSEFFKNIDGIAVYLLDKKPADNMFTVTDRDNAGEYDITADNLLHILEESQKNNMAASIIIKQDFFIQMIETRYTISTINVHE